MQPVWIFRACEKCGGDLFYDIFDEQYVCLQCGLRVNEKNLNTKTREVCSKPV